MQSIVMAEFLGRSERRVVVGFAEPSDPAQRAGRQGAIIEFALPSLQTRRTIPPIAIQCQSFDGFSIEGYRQVSGAA
jgi:hypothetical protein